MSTQKEQSIKTTLQTVERVLRDMEYGEITIKVQKGEPVFVDKFERERVQGN